MCLTDPWWVWKLYQENPKYLAPKIAAQLASNSSWKDLLTTRSHCSWVLQTHWKAVETSGCGHRKGQLWALGNKEYLGTDTVLFGLWFKASLLSKLLCTCAPRQCSKIRLVTGFMPLSFILGPSMLGKWREKSHLLFSHQKWKDDH